MRLLAILLAMLVSPVAAAQIYDASSTPHQLRTMTPPQLGRLLFGADSPPFTDAWVEGPTRAWTAITIDLATTPRSTGYDGLCALKIGSAVFRWDAGSRGEDVTVHLGGTPWTRNAFVLTDDVPGLQPVTGDNGCAERMPYATEYMRPTIFHVTNEIDSDALDFDTSADADVARFGLAALMAARDAAKRLPVKAERCYTGAVAVPASCGDPRAFVQAFYMRQVGGVSVARCPGAQRLCVDGWIQGLRGEGLDHVVVETGETSIAGASPTVRAITVRAGGDPIID